MQYWVCYDVSDDRRRQRLSEALLDFGSRVQESVFACHLETGLAEEMEARITRIVNEIEDKVHILGLCEACGGRVKTFGKAERPSDPEFLII
jgi:CRISPR-associated protein Cas2